MSSHGPTRHSRRDVPSLLAGAGRWSWREKWRRPAAPPRRSGPVCWPARRLPVLRWARALGPRSQLPARRRSQRATAASPEPGDQQCAEVFVPSSVMPAIWACHRGGLSRDKPEPGQEVASAGSRVRRRRPPPMLVAFKEPRMVVCRRPAGPCGPRRMHQGSTPLTIRCVTGWAGVSVFRSGSRRPWQEPAPANPPDSSAPDARPLAPPYLWWK